MTALNPQQRAAWNRALQRFIRSQDRAADASRVSRAEIEAAEAHIDAILAEHRANLDAAEQAALRQAVIVDGIDGKIARKEALIAKHDRELTALRASHSGARVEAKRLDGAVIRARGARPEVPDISAIRGQMARVESSQRGVVAERAKEVARLRRRFALPDDFVEMIPNPAAEPSVAP